MWGYFKPFPVAAGLLTIPPLWCFLNAVRSDNASCHFLVGGAVCAAWSSFAQSILASPARELPAAAIAYLLAATAAVSIAAVLGRSGRPARAAPRRFTPRSLAFASMTMYGVSFLEPVNGLPGFVAFLAGLLTAATLHFSLILICWSANALYVGAVLCFLASRYSIAGILGMVAAAASLIASFSPTLVVETPVPTTMPFLAFAGFGLWAGSMFAITGASIVAACRAWGIRRQTGTPRPSS